jgi:hypothetical protein
MCGVCRVTVDGKMLFGCVDGPEFDGHKTDFDELILRQRTMLPEERLSSVLSEMSGGCKCGSKPKVKKEAVEMAKSLSSRQKLQ